MMEMRSGGHLNMCDIDDVRNGLLFSPLQSVTHCLWTQSMTTVEFCHVGPPPDPGPIRGPQHA